MVLFKKYEITAKHFDFKMNDFLKEILRIAPEIHA